MDIDLNDSVFELEAFVNNVGVGPAMDLVNCEGSGCEEVIECEGSTSEVAIESEGSREKEEVEDPNRIIEPVIGMQFSSITEALVYYKEYAKRLGFAVVKRTNHKKGSCCCHYSFACSKFKKPE